MSWLLIFALIGVGGIILNCPLTQNTSTHLICKIFKNTNIDEIFTNHNFTENNYCLWKFTDQHINNQTYINCSDGLHINEIVVGSKDINGTLDLTYSWPVTMKQIDLEQSYVHSTNIYAAWNWTQFANMPNFVELDLLRNQISGTISNSDWQILASLLKLEIINLAKNNFEVNFTEIYLNKSFKALKYLFLQNNKLYGTLDLSLNGFFAHFPKLINVQMFTSQSKDYDIYGHFDNFDCISNVNLPHLESFDISNNNLSGSLTLSSNYSFNPSLKMFEIDFNNFGGTVNWDIFSDLDNLYQLDIQYNQFNGTINWSIVSDLVINGNLRLIELDHNGFEGYINYSWIPDKIDNVIEFELDLDLNIHCHPDVYPCSGSTLNRAFEQCYNRTHCESSCRCSTGPTESYYVVMITVTFKYVFAINDTSKIINILHETIDTKTFLNNTVTDNCILSDDYNILSSYTQNLTLINATIFVCDYISSQNILSAVVNEGSLETELIKKIKYSTNLKIDANIISIQGEVIHINNNIMTSTDLSSSTPYEAETEQNDDFWMIISIVSSILLCCIVVICIWIICKIRKSNDESKKSEIQISSINNNNISHEMDNIVPGEKDDGMHHQKRREKDIAIVHEWLKTSVQLLNYYDNLINNGYESLAIIKEISNINELNQIGIISIEHQTRMMAEINKLKNKNDQINQQKIVFNMNHEHDIIIDDDAETTMGEHVN